MLASVIGLLYFFMLLFAIAATVLFQDAAYFACVDGGTGDVLAHTATGEMWGCGAEACPANMTCQVTQWASQRHSLTCKPVLSAYLQVRTRHARVPVPPSTCRSTRCGRRCRPLVLATLGSACCPCFKW